MDQPVLVSATWLKEHLSDPELGLIDARVSDPRLPMGYRAGHIPGAIAFDLNRDMYEPGMGMPRMKSPETIAAILGGRGVSNDATLVVYDEGTGPLTGTSYWLFKYLGHDDVRVLDGGWHAWRQANGETTKEIPQRPPAQYAARTDDSHFGSAEWIQANAGRNDLLLLDARTDSEYYMGHIPGAVNLSFDEAIDVATQKLKSPEALRALFENVGVTPDKEVVVYCGSGSRSAHSYLVLKSLGYPRVRNYKGSMMDWSMQGLPIE